MAQTNPYVNIVNKVLNGEIELSGMQITSTAFMLLLQELKWSMAIHYQYGKMSIQFDKQVETLTYSMSWIIPDKLDSVKSVREVLSRCDTIARLSGMTNDEVMDMLVNIQAKIDIERRDDN